MFDRQLRILTLVLLALTAFTLAAAPRDCSAAPQKLFPTDLPQSQWVEFSAAGYPQPVSGVIYRTETPTCCGVPLGAIDTGCLDIDTRGVYGFSCIFNPEAPMPFKAGWRQPRKFPNPQPILGLAVADKAWVLASKEMIAGGKIDWCTEPYLNGRWADSKYEILKVSIPKIEDVTPARDIHYWGHFPVADLQYETDAPVAVSLRAWAPFLPGDSAASNNPSAVFEVHLHNTSDKPQKGALAFNFPGPDNQEARAAEFTRRDIKEDFTGVLISSTGGVNYVLGVIGAENARFGAGLCSTPKAWSKIAAELPQPSRREVGGEKFYLDSSASAAVDFDLAPGAEKIVRFLLAWYAPVWQGAKTDNPIKYDNRFNTRWLASKWDGSTNYYTHMYAGRYGSALDVARRMAVEHESLLKRVLAWQNVIYADQKLPFWLRDSLINNLCLIAEDGMWAQAKPPLGDWAFPHGIFALNESPRGCPDLECIPCDWYGNLPIVYFYPDLARSTLKAFKQYQREDGAAPFWLGIMGDLPDLATPAYDWQISLNGFCYVDMISRLWLRTGDDAILREFYDSAKKCNTMTMKLSTAKVGAVISMPDSGGMEWFEHGDWAGMATHMGALRLAGLKMMENMAKAMGDAEYAQQCRQWFDDGSKAMEQYLWNDTCYLNYNDLAKNKKSDDVMAYQLDGEWASVFHGQGNVFQPDRLKTTLQTVKKCNIALTPDIGAANFTRPDGSPLASPKDAQGKEEVGYYGTHAMFTAEVVVLGMTYMYAGEPDFGMEFVRKHWENLVCKQRHPWDFPNMVDGKDGKRLFGTDYYQVMMLWALPAAIEQTDIKSACKPGSLVDRVIQAACRP